MTCGEIAALVARIVGYVFVVALVSFFLSLVFEIRLRRNQER